MTLLLEKPEKRAPRPRKRIARGKRPARKKKTPLARAHEKLWQLFARYVKDRDGNQCFTCPAQPEGRALQAGHMIRSTKASVRYHPDNVHSQCSHCNKWLSGNEGVYSRRFVEKYGWSKFDALHAKAEQTHEWKVYELEELIAALEKSGADFEILYAEKYGL